MTAFRSTLMVAVMILADLAIVVSLFLPVIFSLSVLVLSSLVLFSDLAAILALENFRDVQSDRSNCSGEPIGGYHGGPAPHDGSGQPERTVGRTGEPLRSRHDDGRRCGPVGSFETQASCLDSDVSRHVFVQELKLLS